MPGYMWVAAYAIMAVCAYQIGAYLVALRRFRAMAKADRVWIEAYPGYGAHHDRDCLVARYPDSSRWGADGFPWCTCRKGLGG